jgi:O-succinylbenzoic acid--CoA ligase
MEAGALISREFWETEFPVMMGEPGPAPEGIPALVYFRTSGSTGEPKWIGLSRTALQVSAAAVNAHLGVGADSCWVLTLPLHHVGGFGVAARAWQAGCRMIRFEGKWDPAAFASWLEANDGTHLSLVPTQVHDLVAAGLRAPDSLRAVVVGGGILAEATGRAARELGWPVLASYGMTEAGTQIATQRLEVLDAPYVREPIDLLSCWEARTGESGRIEIRGAALFSGTLKQEGDRWKYEERSGDWFVTSDSGIVEGNQLSVTGRTDAVVKILGELVDPVAVEAEILSLANGQIAPGQVVVVPVGDPRAGNKLVLAHEISVKATALQEALDRYHASCPGYRRIHGIKAFEAIPRSPLGKPLRGELSRIMTSHTI